MTAKTDRLAKEIAALFVKYSLTDWKPIIDQLRGAGEYGPLGDAIEQYLLEVAQRKKPAKGRSAKARSPKFKGVDRSDNISGDLESLRNLR